MRASGGIGPDTRAPSCSAYRNLAPGPLPLACGCRRSAWLGRNQSRPPNELRIARVRLHAPIENQELPPHVRHAECAVVQVSSIDHFEDVAVTHLGPQRVASVARDGREIDGRHVVNRSVGPHRGAGEYRHDPQRRIGIVSTDGQIDGGAIPGLDQPQLVVLADTVAVKVVPEPESGRIGLGAERPYQHVARIRTRCVLPQRRSDAFRAIRAQGR